MICGFPPKLLKNVLDKESNEYVFIPKSLSVVATCVYEPTYKPQQQNNTQLLSELILR